MYHLDLTSAKQEGTRTYVNDFTVYENIYIRGVQLINNRFLYVLHNPENNLSSRGSADIDISKDFRLTKNGLGLIDMLQFKEPLPEGEIPIILPICEAIVGVNYEIAFRRES
jgi:hypothetical protein